MSVDPFVRVSLLLLTLALCACGPRLLRNDEPAPAPAANLERADQPPQRGPASTATGADDPQLLMHLRTDRQRIRFASTSTNELSRRAAIAAVHDVGALHPLALDHSNWRVRRAAAERVVDPRVLAAVAINDPSRAVRREAIQRLDDPSVLLQIVSREVDPELSRLAVSRLSQPESLRQVIAQSRRSKDRIEALQGLADPTLALELVISSQDPELRLAAARLLPTAGARALHSHSVDPDLRVLLASVLPWDAAQRRLLDDIDPMLRLAALSTLDDPALLAELAGAARHADVRALALGKASNPELALQRLRQDPDPAPRLVAAGQVLADDDVLQNLIESESDSAVQARLVARLNSPTLLEQHARAAEAAVRREAVARLGTSPTVSRLARTDPDPQVRLAAIGRLSDPAELHALLAREQQPSLRRAIAARIGHSDELRRLGQHDRNPRMRLQLTRQLQDPALYAVQAEHDPHWYVRWRALGHITGAALLTRIAQNDSHPEVRARAAVRAGLPVADPAALLVLQRRPDPARSVSVQALNDRRAFERRLRQALATLPGGVAITLSVESVLLETPYVLHDESDASERDSGVLWIEKLSLRASTAAKVLLDMQFNGGRAERSEQFHDAYLDSQGERVAVRLAEVDAIEFLTQLMGVLPTLPPEFNPDDEWLRSAMDMLER